MKHMEERWSAAFGWIFGQGKEGIGLAATIIHAQAICDAHNAALDRAAISDAAFDRACAEPAAQLLKPVMTNAEVQAAIDATVYNIERAKGEAEARLERHLDELLAVQAQRADAAKTT